MTNDVDELKKKVAELEKRVRILEEIENPTDGDTDDPLLIRATELVKQHEFASASLLQRRLSIGYARAARMLDQLEAKGIIGPGKGAEPRDVLKKDAG